MTTIIVALNRSNFFRQKRNLDKLNTLLYKHTLLTPGLLMGATGCDYADAMYVLLVLFEIFLVDGYLLVYNRFDADLPIDRRKFAQGFPKLPITYSSDDTVFRIDAYEDILYEFEFELRGEEIEFVIEREV